MEKTVLIFSENDALREKVNRISKRVNFRLKEVDCDSDVIAIPGFFVILDAKKLTNLLVEYFDEVKSYLETNDQKILIVGSVSKRLLKILPEVISIERRLPDEKKLEEMIFEAWRKRICINPNSKKNNYKPLELFYSKDHISRILHNQHVVKANCYYINIKIFETHFYRYKGPFDDLPF